MTWTVRSFCLTSLLGAAVAPAAALCADTPPQAAAYLPLFIHYAPYAESIWHDTANGGYWGDGMAGGNGGIRGTSNLALAMAMLVHADDQGWLTQPQRAALAKAGLDRAACLRRVRQSWRYLADCHLTANGASAADKKQWGRSWQSSLWVGASGLAALLVWDELPENERQQVCRVAADEADAKIGVPPRDARPGNTAAEENGWDTHAPAIALALLPNHPHAPDWLRAAQLLAVNTCSMRADRTSQARVGADRMAEVVTTANLADDFTLDNHGFFHPSYLKVSGQELGEAWQMMALGDRRHGTQWASRFRPYALHHVADTWNKVLLPLLLPEGEFAFPSGQDWALHTGTCQSCFAFIAVALGDPLAALAERRGLGASQRHAKASRDGRIYGNGDFEWWWEPILLERFAKAMLHFELAGPAAPQPAPGGALTDRDQAYSFPNARIVVRRTPRYFASVSVRKTPTSLIFPLGERHLDHPYVTTPRVGSILPAGTIVDYAEHRHAQGNVVVMTYQDGSRAVMVALRNVVLWAASAPLGPVAVQNDLVATGCGRDVRSASGRHHVPPLVPSENFHSEGPWLNIDEQLGLVSPAGLDYRPAGKITRRSAAEDLIAPRANSGATVLLAAPRYGSKETQRLAETLAVLSSGTRHEISLRDGPTGPEVRMSIDLGRPQPPLPPMELRLEGQAGERSPLENLADGDPATCAVLRNTAGTGPTPEAPVVLEFLRPAGAAACRQLLLVPRPGYGPRDIVLETQRAGAWQTVAKASMKHEPSELACAAGPEGEPFRLMVTSGWDPADPTGRHPRNTQIAQIAFLAGSAEESQRADEVPFELRVVGQAKGE